MAQAKRILSKTIEQKVLKFIDEKELILPGERILVALSGGPDSVFALCFLHKFSNRFKISLGTVHINHGLRGMDSDGDEIFCKELSTEFNVECFVERADVKGLAKLRKISVEEAARELRYKLIEQTARQHGYDKIVTAHNLSDNAETVLLNLIKGTGLRGISGIPVRRGNIIRPLLKLSKQEILDYLELGKICYRTDATNNENIYERNFIRNELLPVIKRNLNPSVELSLFNSSENFRNAQIVTDGFIASLIKEIVEFSGKSILISLNRLINYDPAIFGELLKESISRHFKREFAHNDLVKVKDLMRRQAGRKAELSGNLIVFRERAEP